MLHAMEHRSPRARGLSGGSAPTPLDAHPPKSWSLWELRVGAEVCQEGAVLSASIRVAWRL